MDYVRTAMAEWLVLLVLMPAIVVPVALLVGFAGCSARLTLASPTIDAAVGTSPTSITLLWTWDYPGSKFNIERTNPDNSKTSLQAPFSPFDDSTDLAPSTSYKYRVQGIFPDGTTGDFSGQVTGTTLPLSFQPTFQETLSADDDTWAGKTLVQQIKALTTSGTQVKITLQASSDSDASIDRIYISQPDPTPGANLWDSAADLTPVYDPPIPTPLVIAANTAMTLPPVKYNLDHTQPLLIAFDFRPAPGSGIRYVEPVPPEEATAYSILGAEAKPPRSSGYAAEERIYFITKIEVG
jgi:hypothetical protein